MTRSSRFLWRFAAAALALMSARPATAQTAGATASCVTCHAALPDARLSSPAALFAGTDIHRESRFGCVDCHGGDPAAANKALAHDASKGFKGAPVGQQQIAACGRCHSDAELMRRYAPRQRVDQVAEYGTSTHGKRLATGDRQVATCANCHGAHGIRVVHDAKSPVYPTNVAGTCGTCHASPSHMKGYTQADGSALPTNQLADYQKSVHYAAMTKGNDLSAPTCNDCHGNHGAAPPGIGSVANVCGTCHAVFAQRFAGTAHQQIFDKGCVECHSNHAILRPSDDMLGTGPHAVCTSCHMGADDKGAMAANTMRSSIDRLKGSIDDAGRLVSRVKNAGIEVGAEEVALGSARSRLTLARTEMHTFDPAHVTPVVDEGLRITENVRAAGGRGVAELSYRRRGLALSLGAILLVVVALGLKIRQIDRHV